MKTMTFTLLRETKGALRYIEQGVTENGDPDSSGALVGTLYLRKMAVGRITNGRFPQKIQVTIVEEK